MKTIVLCLFVMISFCNIVHAEGVQLSQSDYLHHVQKAEALAERVHRAGEYNNKMLAKFKAHQGLQQFNQTANIPELSASTTPAALALLLCGALIITGRRKKI